VSCVGPLAENMEKATSEHLKTHNRRVVLKAIYEQEQISRAEIARHTHLTRPAVSRIVAELLDLGLVMETGQGDSHGGKRPTLLALDATAYQVIGVDLTGRRMRAALTDLRGHIQHQLIQQTDRSSGDAVLAGLYAALDELVATARSPLLGIGIGTPGLVASAEGQVYYAANLGWRRLPLRSLLQERYHVPAYVANDTDVAAFGESTFGAGREASSLVMIMVGTGIGAGIVMNGKIWHGAGGLGAGEIGHTPISPDSQIRCSCGRYGCLEAMVSVPSLIRQAQIAAEKYPESSLAREVRSDDLDIEAVARAAAAGDGVAQALVARTGYYLGLAVSWLVSILNPGYIVLGGSILRLGESLLAEIRRTVQERTLPALAANTEIVPSSLGADVGIIGAAALVLSRELGVV